MSSALSAAELKLKDNHILKASTKDANGNRCKSKIDLDTHIGNTDGWFMWGGHDFSKSAEGIRLEGTKLVAMLRKMDGGFRELQGVELSDRIRIADGRLLFIQ